MSAPDPEENIWACAHCRNTLKVPSETSVKGITPSTASLKPPGEGASEVGRNGNEEIAIDLEIYRDLRLADTNGDDLVAHCALEYVSTFQVYSKGPLSWRAAYRKLIALLSWFDILR
jgi:hypothetical protein